MQVALAGEQLLDLGFDPFAKQGTVGQHHGGATALFQDFDDELQEQVGSFTGAQIGREVLLDAILFGAAKGRVGEDHIDIAIPARQRLVEGIAVANLHRYLNAVQQHIGGAKEVRQLLLLNPQDLLLQGLMVG
ncbi:hypothetical protein D3C81_1916930 [compost metagenome]